MNLAKLDFKKDEEHSWDIGFVLKLK